MLAVSALGHVKPRLRAQDYIKLASEVVGRVSWANASASLCYHSENPRNPLLGSVELSRLNSRHKHVQCDGATAPSVCQTTSQMQNLNSTALTAAFSISIPKPRSPNRGSGDGSSMTSFCGRIVPSRSKPEARSVQGSTRSQHGACLRTGSYCFRRWY